MSKDLFSRKLAMVLVRKGGTEFMAGLRAKYASTLLVRGTFTNEPSFLFEALRVTGKAVFLKPKRAGTKTLLGTYFVLDAGN